MSIGIRGALALAVCKAARAVGSAVGRGSSMPGRLALKTDKNILSKIRLPKNIIAVTGSNGKTSTVEMLVHALRANGLTVACNTEGANQLDGVATFILSAASFAGRLDRDVMVMEVDEQSARHIFRYFSPTLYVVTNLYRDQLSRNGHPERIAGLIRRSMADGVKLLLNADDPLTASFGQNREDTVYFGVSRQDGSVPDCGSVYDDGGFCPVCGGRMTYEYRLYNHIGGYACTACDFRRPEVKYEVGAIGDAQIELCGEQTPFRLLGLHNVHNMLAAYAAASELGYGGDTTRRALSEIVLKHGRTVNFRVGENYGTLLISKHENSIAYDCSIRSVASWAKPCTVMILVDAVSRKYFTSDTSWLYDVDFEGLALPFVRGVVLAGRYCHDLAVRFSVTGVDPARIECFESVPEAMAALGKAGRGRVFVFTCFSDKAKALACCEPLPPESALPEPEDEEDGHDEA